MVSSRKLNHGKVQLTESFEKLADNKISIHELMDDLQNDCFKSPSELEALKLVQRYLEPESQMSFSSKCPRIPTRPRIVQIRLQPNDKGFQSLQNIALNVFCRVSTVLSVIIEIAFKEKAGFRLREKRSKGHMRFFISDVSAKSRSERSGLRVGDEILSINGLKLSSSTMGEVQLILFDAMKVVRFFSKKT